MGTDLIRHDILQAVSQGKGLGIAVITRIVAFILLAVLFVSDYMFNLWVKEVPREAYLLIISVALGVDIQFLRDILINALSKSLGVPRNKDSEED